MEQNAPFYINKLIFEFERKKEVNSKYSLRAFALKLGIDAGTLTRILNKKRVPSLMLGKKLCLALGLEENEENLFLNSVAETKWGQNLERVSTELKEFGKPKILKSKFSAYEIELEKYQVLGDWIHYALLELTFHYDFKYDFKWMANELQRSEKEVKQATKRLLKLELLEERDGRLFKTQNRITTKDKSKTTAPLKRLQKDLLKIAKDAIDNVPFEKRASISMTMNIDPKNIEKAKIAFVEFSESMCDLLEEGEQKEIYNLIVNLSPIKKEVRK